MSVSQAHSENLGVASSSVAGLTSPLISSRATTSELPHSPPNGEAADAKVEELASSEPILQLSERDQEFETLIGNLKSALGGTGGKAKVWLLQDERKAFTIMLVDKVSTGPTSNSGVTRRLPQNVRLPLRKIASSASRPDNTPHSPLSPLTPSSPLYPDGVMAPIWVRKHAELVPSVFVLFLRLYEPENPPEGEDQESKVVREMAEKEKEKEMDDALVREIGDRRRRLGERGIKLTVVLMASAATLGR